MTIIPLVAGFSVQTMSTRSLTVDHILYFIVFFIFEDKA